MDRFHRSFAALGLLFAASSAWAQPAPAPAAPAPAPPGAAPAPANLPPVAPAATPAPAAPAAPPGGANPVVLAPQAEPLPPPGAATPPPPPPPEPVAPPAAVPPPPPPPPPPPVGPDKVSVGKSGGFFQPGILLQAWALSTNDSNTPMTSTLRLRRAEFKAKGDISPGVVSYNLMIDAAKLPGFSTQDLAVEDATGAEIGTVSVRQPSGDLSILQDFFITFQSEFADVSVGQFKVPVGHEGSMVSSSKLLFPERAAAVRAFGDYRDMGIKVEKKINDVFYYSLGVYNGSGSNRTDNDNEKDVGLRLEVYPVEGATIGAMGFTTVGERDNTARDRLEGDLKYDANDVYFAAEYIHGWDKPNGPDAPKVEGRGFYVALGYTFIKRIQPAFRIGMVDPNISSSSTNDRSTIYEGGLNYLLRGHEAKLQLAVAAVDPQNEAAYTNWQYTLAAQAAF